MFTEKNLDSLLWIERYRPTQMSEIKSQSNIVNSIEKFLINKNLPHLLFFGTSGSGKTSCIFCACKKLYGDNYRYMILELNASDNRGIDTVRKQIYEFSNTKSMINNGIKTVILDEADSMTIMAQNALRKIIEKKSDNVRFCIICNYINKIIPSLKSRCIQFRFSPLKKDAKLNILRNILQNENFSIQDEYLEIIIKMANGDMRRSINMLQSLSVVYKPDKINSDDIYNYFNIISDKMIHNLWNIINNDEKLSTKVFKIESIFSEKDYNINELLIYLTDNILKSNYNDKQLSYLFDNMAKIEETLLFDFIPEIVLSSLISLFTIVKNI